ncbi:MAG: VOC family protein [Phenylobacterium sp.]|uniref:VOC family protein n=1 Tax=Phenylobacterium sp. TaxID=1871053 RepID=UPI0027350D75|nr:VOC family protein [Phenylobacterium sp.]MDP3172988.1 VOC family protein [Phenylobacterium sp.]
MAIVQRLGYVSMGTRDLDEAVRLYSRVGRLAETERIGDTAFMTANRDHHWLRLHKAETEGVSRVGWDVGGPEGLAAACKVLDEWGLPYEEGKDPKNERVEHRVRFKDPGGMDIELFYGMYQRASSPDMHGIKISKLLHAGWASPNFYETLRFWREGMGFKLSDRVEEAAWFMHCGDRYHHGLLLQQMPVDKPVFGHLCFLVDSLDDLMRIRNHGLKSGAKLSRDILRHAPSGSVGVYFVDAARRHDFEFCYDHAQLPDDHQARILPATPEIGDIWRNDLPDPVTFVH